MVISDRLQGVGKVWWYALAVVLVGCIPLYFVMKASFAATLATSHHYPAYIYQEETKQPLTVTEKKIFNLGDGYYGGYIKVKNVNLEWGVVNQAYSITFRTTGGTEVTSLNNASTFILPASEKIIVFSRFKADRAPTDMEVSLADSVFTHKPAVVQPNLQIQRTSLELVNGQLKVTAAVKNNTPFTIRQINLPILVYDNNGKIVGVNFTSINDVAYQETRSFQFLWPNNPGAVRAEILPEVNIFEKDIYQLPPGQSQFDQTQTNDNGF